MLEVPNELIDKLKHVLHSSGFKFYYINQEKIGNDIHLIIYINKPNYESIDMEEIIEITRKINDFIDDFIDEKYVLEVASSGINRRLYTLEHLREAVGDKVEVVFQKKVPGFERKTQIVLEGVDKQSICLKGQNVLLTDIKKINYIGEDE